jgi:aminobenzoyl-glutamate utilization protein B
MRREHLRPEQRSHYVITDGGDQPNVVPSAASVWYYFREQSFDGISRRASRSANTIAEAAAAKMTDTTVSRTGCSVPRRPAATSTSPLAEAAKANIEKVGLPKWSADEQAFAKAVQKKVGAQGEGPRHPARTSWPPPSRSRRAAARTISATSPGPCRRCRIYYPANIPEAARPPLVERHLHGHARSRP